MIKKQYQAFTLVELLVVIAIIGLLATIVIVTVGTTPMAKARDSRRLNDLKQLQIILENYAALGPTGLYPLSTDNYKISGGGAY